jgi:hypothetical protein
MGVRFSDDGAVPAPRVKVQLPHRRYDPGSDGIQVDVKEFVLVLIVFEYSGLVDPSHHDVVQGARAVQSRLSGHREIIETPSFFVKLIAQLETTSPTHFWIGRASRRDR